MVDFKQKSDCVMFVQKRNSKKKKSVWMQTCIYQRLRASLYLEWRKESRKPNSLKGVDAD